MLHTSSSAASKAGCMRSAFLYRARRIAAVLDRAVDCGSAVLSGNPVICDAQPLPCNCTFDSEVHVALPVLHKCQVGTQVSLLIAACFTKKNSPLSLCALLANCNVSAALLLH